MDTNKFLAEALSEALEAKAESFISLLDEEEIYETVRQEIRQLIKPDTYGRRSHLLTLLENKIVEAVAKQFVEENYNKLIDLIDYNVISKLLHLNVSETTRKSLSK